MSDRRALEEDLPEILVCTVATESNSKLVALRRSCDAFGIDLQVFGLGRTWRGLGWRQRQLYWNLVRRCRRYEYVLAVDGYDTVFTCSLGEVFRRFRAQRTRLLFGAEVVSYPVPADDYPASTACFRYRYLNAGAFIGDLRYVVRLMTALRVFSRHNHCYDQELYARAYLRGSAEIALDHGCEIFQCLFFAGGDLAVRDGRIVNHVTGSTPCIIHANGGTSVSDLRGAESWRPEGCT